MIGDMVVISKQNTEIQEKQIKEDEKNHEGEEEKLNESLEEVDFVNEFVNIKKKKKNAIYFFKEIKNIMILDESNVKDYKLEDVIIPLIGADYEF